MLIDAHSHLDRYPDPDGVLAEMEERRILTVSVAMDPASYRQAADLADRSEWVLPTFGIHPWRAPHWVDRLHEVNDLVDATPMLGEVGLDHRWVEDARERQAQRRVFEHLLVRAAKQEMAINLHCAGAETEALAMLRDHGSRRVIVHWYSGPLDVLAQMIAEGYLFTVGVEVLVSDHIREIARLIPADQLLTELDNPDGLPWLTGEQGRPRHLERVVAEVSRVRDVEPDTVAATVEANFARLMAGDPRLGPWEERLRL